MTRKAQSTKAKIDKQDCIKFRSFSTAKEIINRVKGDLQNGTKHLQTMYLISGYYPKYIKYSYFSIANI